ncbi:MAG: HAD family phosphatase [Fusicatenibacter sp.]|nr:HAD family phosphatase [Lachnospiraceae bacterium]MDY2937390.1 HAD family phosphatase [Fusicatenibacter sp.]
MIDTVIFDVGRVLVDWNYNRYLEEFSFSGEKKAKIKSAIFEGPYWPMADRGILTFDELLHGFISLAPEYQEDICRVIDGAEKTISLYSYSVPFVKELKEKGLRLYLLSNYSRFLLEKTKHKMDFLPYMDGALFSYSCHLIKPEAEIYRLLLDRFQIEPSHAVFFDDTPANVQGAIDLGIHGIHFTGYENARKALTALQVL